MEQNQTPPLPIASTSAATDANQPRKVFTSWRITSVPYLLAAAGIVAALYFSGFASFKLGLYMGGCSAGASFLYGLTRRPQPCKLIYMFAIVAGGLTFLYPEDRGAMLYIISFIFMCYMMHFLGWFFGIVFCNIGRFAVKCTKALTK